MSARSSAAQLARARAMQAEKENEAAGYAVEGFEVCDGGNGAGSGAGSRTERYVLCSRNGRPRVSDTERMGDPGRASSSSGSNAGSNAGSDSGRVFAGGGGLFLEPGQRLQQRGQQQQQQQRGQQQQQQQQQQQRGQQQQQQQQPAASTSCGIAALLRGDERNSASRLACRSHLSDRPSGVGTGGRHTRRALAPVTPLQRREWQCLDDDIHTVRGLR